MYISFARAESRVGVKEYAFFPLDRGVTVSERGVSSEKVYLE